MSFFTDFIIADPSDGLQVVLAIQQAGTPLDGWSGFSVNSINDLDLAHLYGLLRSGSEAKRAMDLVEEFRDLHVAEEGPTVQLVPPDLVRLLASLPEDRLPPVAEKWSDEELRGLRDAADLKELLAQLGELARQAVAEGKS